jgi:hypothetical protein
MMNEELEKLLSRPTADVKDVGRVCFDLCPAASYKAARRGDIPTIRIGGRWKVPTAALRRQLGLDTPNAA